MINAITHMLENIHANIPEEILDLAFNLKGDARSLDQAILDEIVQNRILPDVSAIAGQYKEIVLDPKWASTSTIEAFNYDHHVVPYVVYTIPPEYREHRRIVAVMELGLPYGSHSSLAMMGGMGRACQYMGVTAGTYAEGALNGITGNNNLLMPTPILLDGSRVKLTPMEFGMLQSYSMVLKCRLEYDPDFTNLTPDAVIQLSKLGVTAAKAYVYNKLIIKLDQGAIMSGQEIGKIREIVESYSDQQERYDVLREEFHGSAEALDVNTLRERMLLGICL